MFTNTSLNENFSTFQRTNSLSNSLKKKPQLVKKPSTFFNAKNIKTLFDISQIDLSNRLASADDISTVIPHRNSMALLDWIVWESQNIKQGIALKHVSENEFWVPGHFPKDPIMPGVLMVEAGAQLGCFLVNRMNVSCACGLFLHIEKATFRTAVKPGDQLYILCQVEYKNRKMYRCDLQGLANNKVAFEAQIIGMSNTTK